MSEKKDHVADAPGKGKTFLPPLDFSSIVALLYIPAKNAPDIDLPQARRLIDLLDLLADRTKGRLEPEEEKFLEFVLSELKMQYLEKTETVKL